MQVYRLVKICWDEKYVIVIIVSHIYKPRGVTTNQAVEAGSIRHIALHRSLSGCVHSRWVTAVLCRPSHFAICKFR